MRRRSVVALRRAAWVLSVIAGIGGAQAAPTAQFLGQYTWTNAHPLFGGFSGIDLSDDGNTAYLVSDRGSIAVAAITRVKGAVSAVQLQSLDRLKGIDSDRLARFFDDAEGIALGPDGIYVSFESKHRVWRYATPTSRATALPEHPDFADMQNNSSLEAVAIDASGAVYTLPERSGALDRPFPIYRLRGETWDQPFALRRDGDFLAVGADFGPDGKLYLLERDLGLFGFASRVRRFTIQDDRIVDEELVLAPPTGSYDNLEGISVWADSTGRTRITMISDNNFRVFQRTEFVDYALTEPLAPQDTTK